MFETRENVTQTGNGKPNIVGNGLSEFAFGSGIVPGIVSEMEKWYTTFPALWQSCVYHRYQSSLFHYVLITKIFVWKACSHCENHYVLSLGFGFAFIILC